MTARFFRLRIRRGLFVAAAMLGIALGAWAAAPQSAPNIILILADDLGYGDLGCYGQQDIRTPNLDRMAAEGMRLTQFYTGCPVCAPARNTLLTGQHTGHALLRANAKLDLRPEDVTLAEVLKPAGYVSAAIGKWGVGAEGSTGAPRRKGFDYFFGYVDQTMAHNYYPTFLVRNEEHVPLRNVVPHPGPYHQGVATERVEYSADLIAEDAIRFIREHQRQRFLLYFTPTLPHANGEAKDEGMEVPDYGLYASRDWPKPKKGYAAMVSRLDDEVGGILAELKRLGLDRETIVFFTSDNGPHSEGGYRPEYFNSSGGLRGQKRDLFEGGIREPMIVRWPGHIEAGTTTDVLGYFPDLLPTLAELAGATIPAGVDGVSLVQTLLRRAQPVRPRNYLYWEFYEGETSQAVRFGPWKAIRAPMLTGEIRLYNLDTDRMEGRDVAAQHPDLVERARQAMAESHEPSPYWKPRRGPRAPSTDVSRTGSASP